MKEKTVKFDTSSWQSSLRRGDFRAYYQATSTPFYKKTSAVVFVLVLFLAAVSAFDLYVLPWLATASDTAEPPAFLRFMPLVMLVWAVVAAAAYIGVVRRKVRFFRFCQQNGLTYRGEVINMKLAGSAFVSNYNHSSITSPLIIGERRGETFSIGRYVVHSDKKDNNMLIRPFVFARSRLPRKVPHLIVKNKNSRIIPLVGAVRSNAGVQPEGDFANKYTIICPKNYEIEALQIFTPDVLAAIYDFASDAEIELVDDELFLYTRSRAVFSNPEKFANLFNLIVGLDARFDKRAVKHKDVFASIGRGEIGRRLKLSQVSWLTVIWWVVISAVIIFQVLRALNIGPFNDWLIELFKKLNLTPD